MTTRALIILHPDFEEIEAVTPIDLLARAQIEVTQASLDENRLVRGRNGMTLQATHCLTDIAHEVFDVIILPGGPGIAKIRNHPLICKLLRKQHAADKLIACICAAPLLLLDAGLHSNLNYTCHPAAEEELSNATKSPVVTDGNIITSRGAGTATEFALHIVQYLTDSKTTAEIADSICWTHAL